MQNEIDSCNSKQIKPLNTYLILKYFFKGAKPEYRIIDNFYTRKYRAFFKKKTLYQNIAAYLIFELG